jgi:hypothetical protein
MQTSDKQNRAGDLSHPSREEWIDWLYGEVPQEKRAAFDVHLASCAKCGDQVAQWKSAMNELDEWQVPAPARELTVHATHRSNNWKWAAAAAVLLSAGFLVGRVNSATGLSQSQLQAAISQRVDERIRASQAQLMADWAAYNASNRVALAKSITELSATLKDAHDADQQVVLTALKDLDAKWLEAYANLRRELETVAIFTDSRIKDTQQQLVQIATETPGDVEK